MKFGEFVTGEQAERDDLISFINHCEHDCAAFERYAQDAREAGDEELAEFFREAQAQDRFRAWRAEELLKQRI